MLPLARRVCDFLTYFERGSTLWCLFMGSKESALTVTAVKAKSEGPVNRGLKAGEQEGVRWLRQPADDAPVFSERLEARNDVIRDTIAYPLIELA